MSSKAWEEDLDLAVKEATEAGETLERFMEALAFRAGCYVLEFADNEPDPREEML